MVIVNIKECSKQQLLQTQIIATIANIGIVVVLIRFTITAVALCRVYIFLINRSVRKMRLALIFLRRMDCYGTPNLGFCVAVYHNIYHIPINTAMNFS